MSREEQIAEAAARIAVKKTFAILGVDIDNPSQVEEFRQDLRFARIMRQQAMRGIGALVVTVVGGVVVALWAGIKIKLSG